MLKRPGQEDATLRFRLRADACVAAMDSPSPLLAAPPGLRRPIDPATGSPVTMPVKDAAMAHQVRCPTTGRRRSSRA